MKTQTMSIREFMAGDYKVKEKKQRDAKIKKSQQSMERIALVAAGLSIPLALGSPIGAVLGASKAFASTTVPSATSVAVPATAKEWMGEQTLSALAHVLDPVVDILVALSFPVASVIIVGACFLFMMGNSERGWTMIQNAGLGYVLIQVSPLILNVLKQVGNAV
ncbi:hypothetical protein ACFRCQ_27280 [Cytobacillus firmus]|uniref:hypothetical protein n=1 Tax=Cytobacillus firmus TaxID=1399 RepID=UPI003674A9B4